MLAVLCCTAGNFAFIDSLDAAELLLSVFWKKSKMLAELLASSHDLFLEAGPPPAAPDVLIPLLESLKYLDCCGFWGLDSVGTKDGDLEWVDLLGLGLVEGGKSEKVLNTGIQSVLD